MPHANNSWKDIVIDAGIAGGVAGVTVAALSPLPDPRSLYAAGLAFLAAFFASLTAARGRHAEA
jgi:hypothetical protein